VLCVVSVMTMIVVNVNIGAHDKFFIFYFLIIHVDELVTPI
jgi:hypothetical protein